MKCTFLFIVTVFILFSCRKKAEERIRLSDVTNESDYKMTVQKKVSDTVVIVKGENARYILKGYKDIKHNEKVGWWKLEDKKNNYRYEIEYIPGQKKENQCQVYKNGKLINQLSQYYDVLYRDNSYHFKFYFPQYYSYESVYVEFRYEDPNTFTRKTIKCKKENDYYICSVPVKNKDQLIIGTAIEFGSIKQRNGNILLSARTMLVYSK